MYHRFNSFCISIKFFIFINSFESSVFQQLSMMSLILSSESFEYMIYFFIHLQNSLCLVVVYIFSFIFLSHCRSDLILYTKKYFKNSFK